MKTLLKISSSLVVGIDIETVRKWDRLEDAPEEIQMSWSYKNKDKGKIRPFEELEVLWIEQASLYAEFSKVCSVSMVFKAPDGRLMCQNFTDEDEQFILAGVANMCNRMQAKSIKYRLIGHSAKYFDYPFLCKRYVINGMLVPDLLDHSGLKPWEVLNLDTNELWKFAGTGPGSSLPALCACLGIPVSKDDMVGSDVGQEFYGGNLIGIGQYCDKDTVATFNVFLTFKGEPIFQFDEVVYLDPIEKILDESGEAVTTVEAVADVRVLERIFNEKGFSEQDKLDIEGRVLNHKIKMSKKDWEFLETTLSSLYCNTKIMQSDKPAILDEKRAEVADFIEDLKKKKDAKA